MAEALLWITNGAALVYVTELQSLALKFFNSVQMFNFL